MNKMIAMLAAGLALSAFADTNSNTRSSGAVQWARNGSVGRNDYVVTNIVESQIMIPMSNVTNANGQSALSSLDYKADAEIKGSAHEYVFPTIVSSGTSFDVTVGLREQVVQNFTGNHLEYVKVSKNGTRWTNVTTSMGSWLNIYDGDNANDYVMMRKNASDWEVRVTQPFLSTNTVPSHALTYTYKSVYESVSNLVTKTTTVNGKPLSGDISLSAPDVGAVASSGNAINMYGNSYVVKSPNATPNYLQTSIAKDKVQLDCTYNGTNSHLVIRDWLSGTERPGIGFDVSYGSYISSFLFPDTSSATSDSTYRFATEELLSRDYLTKSGVIATSRVEVASALSSYTPLYLWNSTATARTAQDGTMQYRKWSGNGLAWTNRTSGVFFYNDGLSSDTWHCDSSALGACTLKYNSSNSMYYLQEFPMARYVEPMYHVTSITLGPLGTFEAIDNSPNFDPISWAESGKTITTEDVGSRENAKAAMDWWYRQGVKWEVDDHDLLWTGTNWTYSAGDTLYTIAFSVEPDDESDSATYVLTKKSGDVTETGTVTTDYRKFGTYSDTVQFSNGTYADRIRMRNVKPKDYEADRKIDGHISNQSNPHQVTAAQIGAVATNAQGELTSNKLSVRGYVGNSTRMNTVFDFVGSDESQHGYSFILGGGGQYSAFTVVGDDQEATLSVKGPVNTGNLTVGDEYGAKIQVGAGVAGEIQLGDEAGVMLKLLPGGIEERLALGPEYPAGFRLWNGGAISNIFFQKIGAWGRETYTMTFPDKNGTFAMTSDIPTDYIAQYGTTNSVPTIIASAVSDATNAMNSVKAKFYDEQLQTEWTLRMVNGEMKLYATTNVNTSVLQ